MKNAKRDLLEFEWRQTCVTCRASNLCHRSQSSNYIAHHFTVFDKYDVAGFHFASRQLCSALCMVVLSMALTRLARCLRLYGGGYSSRPEP